MVKRLHFASFEHVFTKKAKSINPHRVWRLKMAQCSVGFIYTSNSGGFSLSEFLPRSLKPKSLLVALNATFGGDKKSRNV